MEYGDLKCLMLHLIKELLEITFGAPHGGASSICGRYSAALFKNCVDQDATLHAGTWHTNVNHLPVLLIRLAIAYFYLLHHSQNMKQYYSMSWIHRISATLPALEQCLGGIPLMWQIPRGLILLPGYTMQPHHLLRLNFCGFCFTLWALYSKSKWDRILTDTCTLFRDSSTLPSSDTDWNTM